MGFAACALVTGYLAENLRNPGFKDVFAVIPGSLAIYLFGVPWLKLVTAMSWEKAMMVGMLPFLPGDAIKAAAAVILARAIRPMVKHQLGSLPTVWLLALSLWLVAR